MTTMTDEMLETAARVREKLDRINESMALRHARERSSATIVLNPMDDLLSELQLLASNVIVDEVDPGDVRAALTRFARKFEELDSAMAGGLPLPTEWQRRRKR